MRILFASSEVAPFIKTGGLADVAGSLPKALAQEGHDVKVILPLYEGVGEQWRSQMKFEQYYNVTLSWRHVYCGVFSLEQDGVTYWFVDNEYYFKRWQLYGHFDDCERFAYFSRAVIETPGHFGWAPDIIHCNDWQTTPRRCSPSTTSSIRAATATRYWRTSLAWTAAISTRGCWATTRTST